MQLDSNLGHSSDWWQPPVKNHMSCKVTTTCLIFESLPISFETSIIPACQWRWITQVSLLNLSDNFLMLRSLYKEKRGSCLWLRTTKKSNNASKNTFGCLNMTEIIFPSVSDTISALIPAICCCSHNRTADLPAPPDVENTTW